MSIDKAQPDARAAAAFYHALILSRVEVLAAIELTKNYMNTRAIADTLAQKPPEPWEKG